MSKQGEVEAAIEMAERLGKLGVKRFQVSTAGVEMEFFERPMAQEAVIAAPITEEVARELRRDRAAEEGASLPPEEDGMTFPSGDVPRFERRSRKNGAPPPAPAPKNGEPELDPLMFGGPND